uniref:Putative fms n=1 Tax=Corethrella appendiculata TaxID=1370023 RepID=U5EKA3_9DIPT
MVNKTEAIDKDGSDKKRRKTTTSETSSITTTISPVKLSKEEIYTNTINFEEKESIKRTPEKDAIIFHNTCEDIRHLFKEISVLKKENTDEARSKIADKRIEGSLAFVLLKKLNRLDKVRIRSGRDALHKEKLRVDSNRLQLQNLLYEADHLKKEVQRCYQFKSQDEEIDLVSLDEFYAAAPQTISQPEKTKTDEHALRIARLEWELQQRKELDALRKELQASKQKVATEIVTKTERLESLAPRLQDLLKATRPLQEALEMEFEKGWEIQKIVRLLVRPLYLLYANISAYSEACDPLIVAQIDGDEEEAKQISIDMEKGSANNEVAENAPQQDSDDEMDGDGERAKSKKRHHHQRQTSTKESILEEKRDQFLKPHPLSVTVTIKVKESKGAISLIFQYLSKMEIVTVGCKLSDFEITGIAAGDVISSENILNGLFSDDHCLESPNPKTKYQLEDLSISTKQFLSLLDERRLGKPYKWAQQLCGLEFISTNKSQSISNDLCQNTIPNVVKLLKTRWSSRLNLYKQIHEIESGSIDTTTLNPEHNLPIKVSSNLLQWTSITFDEYTSSNIVQKFIDANIATSYDLYYRGIITRGSAKLECYVCISCNFPVKPIYWSIVLNWNGKHCADNNSTIREMEFWINSINQQKYSKTLLAVQLKRAITSLDIYLETEAPLHSPIEFTQDKTFLRGFRGRVRSRPFKISSNGSSVVFTQI